MTKLELFDDLVKSIYTIADEQRKTINMEFGNYKHRDNENYELSKHKFSNIKGVFEMHHFFDMIGTEEKPIEQKYIDYFDNICEIINQHFKDFFNGKKMKSPHLCLNFNMKEMHNSNGLYDPTDPNFNKYVSVLQPSLYLIDFNYEEAVYITHKFTEIFNHFGFNVIREKIECCVRGTTGLPLTREEALENAKLYKKYFEFHISIKGNNDSIYTESNLYKINELVSNIQQFLGLRIAFSYNKHHEGQIFINIRCRTLSTNDCLKLMNFISKFIKDSNKYYVNKIIEEYIVYDIFSSLDSGWIDSNEILLDKLYECESNAIDEINKI